MGVYDCAMMGLQATTTALAGGKRRPEGGAVALCPTPAKVSRWEPPPATPDDCIARLRAVAVPDDAWATRPATPLPPTNAGTPPGCTPLPPSQVATPPSVTSLPSPPVTTSTLKTTTGNTNSTTLLSDEEFDDDEFDDELDEGDKCHTLPEPARYVQSFGTIGNRYTHQQQAEYWSYYSPNQQQQQQQTIRCDANGKSYLELGAATPPPRQTPPSQTRCFCDGRMRWCHAPCYRQRRLAVLNLSVCKLARYRQCSDPSLRRSVLICNTLRRLEREMESEPPAPTEPTYPGLPEIAPPCRPSPALQPPSQTQPEASPSPSYETNLRELAGGGACGRATPFPTPAVDTDSGLGDDEDSRPINWGSVLSLTAQTDLEALNNNELYAELGLGDEWKEPLGQSASRTDGEWDGFVQVLVGGT